MPFELPGALDQIFVDRVEDDLKSNGKMIDWQRTSGSPPEFFWLFHTSPWPCIYRQCFEWRVLN